MEFYSRAHGRYASRLRQIAAQRMQRRRPALAACRHASCDAQIGPRPTLHGLCIVASDEPSCQTEQSLEPIEHCGGEA